MGKRRDADVEEVVSRKGGKSKSKSKSRDERWEGGKGKRTTRSSNKGRIISGSSSTTASLDSQLSAMSLYAARTLGDGNCLFRALSDQYYGTPSKYADVRRDVCNWIEENPERYEGFVDEDEFGNSGGRNGETKLTKYLSGMRANGTYGGHMELSAFSHMVRRDVKVVQPGLVYVIQWDHTQGLVKREEEEPDLGAMTGEAEDGPLYVAYHDWEHFSSIRNLRGPHAGLPCVRESPTPTPDKPPKPTPSSKKPPTRITKIRLKLPPPPLPEMIPLPPSPSTPTSSSFSPSSSPPFSSALTSLRSSATPAPTSTSSSSSSSNSKRARTPSVSSPTCTPKRSRLAEARLDLDEALSDLTDWEDDDHDHEKSRAPSPPPQKLTRRERKRLGLPKPRPTIRIPGGRYVPPPTTRTKVEGGVAQWEDNGIGRVDERGFRELKV